MKAIGLMDAVNVVCTVSIILTVIGEQKVLYVGASQLITRSSHLTSLPFC